MSVILEIAERNYGSGAQRYRFECWLISAAYLFKKTYLFHLRKNRVVKTRDSTNGRQVLLRILAERLEHLPYGSGRGATNQTRYREYFDNLIRDGIVAWGAPFFNPKDETASRMRQFGRPTGWWVPQPSGRVEVSQLCAAPWILPRALDYLPAVNGRAVTLQEGYHALYLHRKSVALENRYGRKTASRLRTYIQILTDYLEGNVFSLPIDNLKRNAA